MTSLLATLPGKVVAQAAIFVVWLAATAAIWTGIIARWRRREPIIPLARRRPVPWHVQDVLFILLLAMLLPITVVGAVRAWMGPYAQQAVDQQPGMAHPAEQLLRAGTVYEKAIAVVMAVLVAPLIEEFFFRVLLQGWLEAVWSRRRRKHPELRSAPMSWIPIVLPAALFAIMHFRASKEPPSPQYLAVLFLAQMGANMLAFWLAVVVLRFATGATAADLGWKPEKLRGDLKLGLLALLAAIGPVLALQGVLMGLVKWKGIDYAPDPIPLFFLALVLGTLYHRTHRIAPSLVLHIAFNATAIALLFAG
jgi:membrane protease YdiL (CAAX protease family)